MPEDRGRLVTAFLTNFFERYVEYNFTADLENQLDDVSGGRIDWKEVLRNFWRDFSAAIDGTKELTISQVLTALDEALGPHFFPNDGSGHDPRLCPVCGAGRLSLKLGKFGAFIGCSNYPNCRFTRPLAVESDAEATPPETALGTDPGTGLAVTLKKGPYGHYVQLGEGNGEFKPKRVALPRSLKPSRNRSRDCPPAARVATRARPPSRNGRGDHRRHRPVRRVHQARNDLQIARPSTTTC